MRSMVVGDARGSSRQTVLVAEDNPSTRKLVRMTLESAGYAVEEASSGQTALALFETVPIDLVIQDLLLPDIEGFELVRRLRALRRGAEVPILAFSGFVSKMEEARILNIGFSGYLVKPVEPSQLLREIRAYLREASPSVDTAAGRGRSVLVVNDDPTAARLTQLQLERLGFAVSAELSGAHALQRIATSTPDAVVSDVLMPGMNGYELCLAIRNNASLRGIPVVLSSAYVSGEVAATLGRDVGADAFVPATADGKTIAEALLTTLERRRARTELVIRPAALEPVSSVLRELERQVAVAGKLAQVCAAQDVELSFLAGLSDVIRRSPDIECILAEIAARYLDSDDAYAAVAVYLDEQSGAVALRAYVGGSEPLRGVAEKLAESALLRDARGEKAGNIRVLTAGDDPLGELRPSVVTAGVGSLVVAPLVDVTRRIGALVAFSRVETMGPDRVKFAKVAAAQIGQAIGLVRVHAGLRASERRYRELVETLDVIVWEADLQQTAYSFVSASAERMLGYPIDDWRNEPHFWANHVHPSDRSTTTALLRAITESKGSGELKYRMIAADGRMLWIHEQLHVVNAPDGGSIARGVMVDITDQVQLEQQLRQAQKMEAVGQLAGGVAHEFNNILLVILGQCELLLGSGRRGSAGVMGSVRENIDEIRRAAVRATDLTRQMLAFGRKESLAIQLVDLNSLIIDLIKVARILTGEHIELVTLLDPRLGCVRADAWQMTQAIVNLIINARDAMPSGGRITIETRRVAANGPAAGTTERALLSVADTGIGMDAETQQHLFEPFFTTKEVGKGTGLGLFTVMGTVKESGGDIAVDSEPGKGTTFRITLPCVEGRSDFRAAPVPRTDVELPRGHETVLVIEDDPDARAITVRFLESLGYKVLVASDGVDGLRVASEHASSIDVLLSDMIMPRMNGPEVAARLGALHRNMAVIFTSGYPAARSSPFSGMPEDSHFLAKPFSLELLANTLRDVLARRK